jgi:fatty acid desaturase
MSPMLLYPEQAIAEGTFTGTPEQARTFLNLFLLVLLFGALGTVNALYMISTGRQNRWFVIGTLVLAVVLYGSAFSIIHWSK